MRINFVMSNNVQSGIFNSIIGYFKKYLPVEHEFYVSEFPIENADIYHYHRPNLEQSLKLNSVVTVHHDLEDTDPWFDASTYIERYREANLIICLNTIQEKLLHSYGLQNTIVIPHGVNDRLFFQQKREIKQDAKITIGIISKHYGRRVKGEALMLELYKRLNSNKIKFIFVGEGRYKDKLLCNSFGFDAEAFEELPYSLFNSLYSEIDILLVASLFEGGPANIPEALYTRTPIIGRRIAMIADVLEEGINGYYLTGDPDKDADLINSLADNQDNLLVDLFSNINEYKPNVLIWEEVVNKHLESYERMIERLL